MKKIPISILDEDLDPILDFESLREYINYTNCGYNLGGSINRILNEGKAVRNLGHIICQTRFVNSSRLSLSPGLKREASVRLKKINRYLRKRGRRVLILDTSFNIIRGFEGSLRDLAVQLDCSEGNVKARLSKEPNMIMKSFKSSGGKRYYANSVIIYQKDYTKLRNEISALKNRI